ncbi:MAG TPA: universal stress protein [Propionibacteriaceae bacterium]|nr:universal stress protein [Propionibacteriaceae bacterium]
MRNIRRIVVGVDGSDTSRAALRWAYDEAASHGASLTVVTAWHSPPLPQLPPYGSLPPEGYFDQPKHNALALLDGLTAGLGDGPPRVDVRSVVEEGNPVQVLIEQSAGADLLVVGSRGHGGFAGMLLGSVSHHLVAHSKCPVVVVR